MSGSKVRHFDIPDFELKAVQRRIANMLSKHLLLSACSHGGIRGRSPSTNAATHLGQRYVANVDVRNFFPSARHYVVYRTFRHELGFGRDVASLLTRLVTVDSKIPQGAPSSTIVANALLDSLDKQIQAVATRRGLRYGRFVDDIGISGDNPRDLINLVARRLSGKRLQIHRPNRRSTRSKLTIRSQRQRQQITGLVVNSAHQLSVSRSYRDEVRAAIFALSCVADKEARNRGARSIMGKIAHIRRFNPGAADRLQRYLNRRMPDALAGQRL